MRQRQVCMDWAVSNWHMTATNSATPTRSKPGAIKQSKAHMRCTSDANQTYPYHIQSGHIWWKNDVGDIRTGDKCLPRQPEDVDVLRHVCVECAAAVIKLPKSDIWGIVPTAIVSYFPLGGNVMDGWSLTSCCCCIWHIYCYLCQMSSWRIHK